MKFAHVSGSRPLDGYTIKRGIGMGGFGEVYYAISDAGKEVALKHIQRNLDIELRGVSQCLNLKHPNLLALFDIKYDEAGEGWVVMEYVPGESLKDVVSRNPNGMPLDQVNFWFAGLAAGVACLHDHGIVHRDLKPGNLFNDAGIVKVGDYGLSKFISVSRRSCQTESVGTFHYMAPEIGKGSYGKEIDVYALGIILFEMLTGQLPFEGETSQEIIMKHLTAEPDLGRLVQPYRRVVLRALAKDPDERYSTVGQMLDHLEPGPVDPAAAGALPPTEPQSPARAEPAGDNTLRISDDGKDVMVFGPVEHLEAPSPEPAAAIPINDEEPIAHAVHVGLGRLRRWFNDAHFSAPVKVLLLLAGIFLVLLNVSWLVPLAMVFGIIYAVYFVVRSITMVHSPQPGHARPNTKQAAEPAPADPGHQRRHRSRPDHPQHRRRRWYETAREQLRAKPRRERLAELTGSLLMAAVVAAVLCIVMMALGGRALGDGAVYVWGPFYAWLTLTSIAGTWAVLLFAKLWEGHKGEQVLRRFAMLAIGLALGAAACGVDHLLLVDLTYSEFAGEIARKLDIPTHRLTSDQSPTLPAYLAYFAGLFLLLRWWHGADPLRPTRLSLWATGMCVLCAWVLDVFLPFPQPWGFMLAATISIAVQLSAPWMPPRERARIRQQLQQV